MPAIQARRLDLQQAALIAADRPRSRKSSFGDALFAFVTRASGIFVLVLLGAIIVALFRNRSTINVGEIDSMKG